MTPPEETGSAVTATQSPRAVLCISTLKTRPEFLRTASARRQGTSGFLVQARFRDDGEGEVKVGFTASKKIGNAVKRNRAKRRLREVARAVLSRLGLPGWDYVLVARPGVTVDRPFADLLTDMEGALRSLHRGK